MRIMLHIFFPAAFAAAPPNLLVSVSCAPHGCWGHGECVEGKCVCDAGFGGSECRLAIDDFCPNSCSGRGRCGDDRVCSCAKGFVGSACELIDANSTRVQCPFACSGHGRCGEDGSCSCDVGFVGDACDRAQQPSGACPFSCSGHGRCGPDGKCGCFPGFKGDACNRIASTPSAPAATSFTITTSTAMATAAAKITASAVTFLPVAACPAGCSGHGWCQADGRCRCDEGFGGPACSALIPGAGGACPANCSGHGTCEHGQCSCKPQLHFAWGGMSCERLLPTDGCPNHCSGQGTCKALRPGKGACVCRHGFSGSDCSTVLSCPSRCNGRGDCVAGRCECDRGWKGSACEAPQCLHDCSGHGECLPGTNQGRHALGLCLCAGGWAGVACDVWRPHCPNDCGARGTCVAGRCRCEPGFVGDACAARKGAAPSAAKLALAMGEASCGATLCNGNGSCQRGRAEGTVLCACYDGFGGPRCKSRGALRAPAAAAEGGQR